ncbi:glycoside hydrolase family 3 [Trichoderma arundinaceum]|uniref:Beta-glucosidase cel3A n=1 Tax=Trichoderma arundinaceum TaxID=490622 RepID=A0A395NVC5_TRIAR|nr:glycoside hydrolase family 3 [Trichoderma arundinaceum]
MHYKTAAALAIATAPFIQAESASSPRPAVAPPAGSPWGVAYDKAKVALAKLSLQDKVGIVTGVGWNKGPCVGNTSPVSKIGYPQLCLQDGPLGVRFSTGSTAFTPGVQAASTWDLNLIRQRGQFIGEEVKGSGIHVTLGPVAGPLGKTPQGGRNWEGFSPDPYLTGLAMAETISAIQATGVQATAKHYILNEQELNRESVSSNPDDRTLHELYAWPFADAVHANVASVMCSYNKVNTTWACEDQYTLQTVLKDQLGFPGYVMTDWNAQHSTVKSAVSGLDMSMPGTDFNGGSIFWGSALTNAVNSNQVPTSRVDDMVTRILAAWYLAGQDASGFPSFSLSRNVQANHKSNVRAIARDGIVLLKNDANILPLKKPASIAVVGSAAVLGAHANNSNSCSDKGCNNGALGMGWGSGSVNYPYFVAPYDAINTRATSQGARVTLSNTDNASSGASAASGKDVAIVFITADSGEGYITVEGNAGDRNDLNAWHNGNALVQAVAGANSNVIVVVHSVGAIILEQILALPQVKAVVWAGLPSQESGNALVDILWGDVSPSGKLVYTIAKNPSDYNTRVVSGGSDSFSEGLFIDYKHFDDAKITPRYEFGFGLSYTKFDYSGLSVTSNARSGPATGPVVPGGPSDLFDNVATITVNVRNSGQVTGAEVAQLYLTYPSSAPRTPPKQLRGFAKLNLTAGQSGTATFNIRKRDLSYWDVNSQKWVVPSGSFGISVGASSRDIRLTGSLSVS